MAGLVVIGCLCHSFLVTDTFRALMVALALVGIGVLVLLARSPDDR